LLTNLRKYFFRFSIRKQGTCQLIRRNRPGSFHVSEDYEATHYGNAKLTVRA